MFRKVVARVFCQRGQGGHPVTLFAGRFPDVATQVRLARQCQGNQDPSSVVVMVHEDASTTTTTRATSDNHVVAFYRPTGEQVPLCAHAALAAVHYLGGQPSPQQPDKNDNDGSSSSSQTTASTSPRPVSLSLAAVAPSEDSAPLSSSSSSTTTTPTLPPLAATSDTETTAATTTTTPHSATTTTITGTVHEDGIVRLQVQHLPWTAASLPHPPGLVRLLREVCGVPSAALEAPSPYEAAIYPTMGNVGVGGSAARSSAEPSHSHHPHNNHKTLVYLPSVDDLRAARSPSADDRAAAHFARACPTLESSGLFLYTPLDRTTEKGHRPRTSRDKDSPNDDDDHTVAVECREFLPSSADPDPGGAAAALAVALTRTAPPSLVAYKFQYHRNHDSDQPSVLVVEDVTLEPSLPLDGDEGTTTRRDDDDDEQGSASLTGHVSFRLLGQVQVDDQGTTTTTTDDMARETRREY
jgi:hypothetical protein